MVEDIVGEVRCVKFFSIRYGGEKFFIKFVKFFFYIID